jgi:hypothetical protein
MPIYDRSTKELMHDFATEMLKPGQVFGKQDAIKWFAAKYPKIKPTTVAAHVGGMAINAPVRKHNPNIQPNRGWDLFYKISDGQFRIWDEQNDPAPKYIQDYKRGADESDDEVEADDSDSELSPEFAYEQHLQHYLVKNLSAIEPGLRVYEDEGMTGVEYTVGKGRIDILAVDTKGDFIVIELKVSRGHDRAIGQLLSYMGWIEKNLADGKNVRGIIVASDISENLRLAASRIPDVKLLQYEISFSLKPVAT